MKAWLIGLFTFVFILGSLGALPVRVHAATISSYALPSIYTASTVYGLKVDATTIPVVSYTSDYDYAHFSMSGSATIEVTAIGQTSISSYSISPKKLNLTGTTSGNKLTFTVSGDEYLIVKINGQRALVIAADPAESNKPASSGTGIYNVKNAPYNADSTGAGMATTAIQNAINDAASYTGGQGIVYVPAGIYKAGNLQLKSDVALYLEGGAVLRFTGVASDYTVNWHKDSQNRDVTWWLYTPTGADNVKIYGRGTIDGNGKYATTTNNFASNLIVPIGTTNFTLDGPLLRDSGSWAVTPARSNDLTFKNMKIFNRFDMGENDGIDVNESQNVLVQHGIGIGLDDPYTTKTWDQATDISLSWPGSPEPVSNVVFDDLISWTVCFGYKVGQGMRQNQSDVTFKNSVVYDASVGIGVDHKYGVGNLTNVTFENIDIERITYTNDSTRTWASFIIRNADGFGGGTINTLTVKDILVRDAGTTLGTLKGYSSTKNISNITFNNVVMPGSATPAQNLAQMNILNRANHTPVTILPTQIAEPVQRVNLALNKPATASSGAAAPSLSFDGNFGTRWGSSYTDNEWIYVDLGSPVYVDGAKLYWEAAYGKNYQIQVSNDGSIWTNVFSTTTGNGGVDEISFTPTLARYVKMNGTLRGSVYGYSLWEFEVYGAAGNLAMGATVSGSSSVENTNFSAAKINDGQRSSVTGSMGWSSNNSLTSNHTELVTLDMGSSKTISKVDLFPRNDAGNVGQNFPIDFTIKTSADNVNWSTVVARTGYAQPGNAVQSFAFSAVSARYVKIEGTNLRPNPSDANQYRMAFAEVELYATNYATGAIVSASSSLENSNYSTSRVNDGGRNSVTGSMGWTSNNSLTANHTESVTLDMGGSRSVSMVDIYPRNDAGNIGQNFPIDFTIKTSADNVNWSTVVTRTGYAQPGNAVQSFAFSAVSARYVKIEGTNLRPNPTDANRYRMAFPEVEIY
ncbi:discoidin domain-containing protein [Paenibacillus qinlingensis]|nr:discoidin domain-containing protein [Paenibacillus qinlingensis]